MHEDCIASKTAQLSLNLVEWELYQQDTIFLSKGGGGRGEGYIKIQPVIL